MSYPAAILGAPPHTRARRPKWFFNALAVLMTATVVAGFWPSYFSPLLRGAAQRPWVIHLHGAIFAGWMALLLLQIALASTGRIRLHRKAGKVGFFYGFLVLAMGLVVSFAAPILRLRSGEWNMDQAARFLVVPLGDMVLFGGFLIPAILYRNRPEIHKRLIVLATVALLFAAVARLPVPASTPAKLFVWFLPLLVAIGHDGFTRRRVHPVYIIGFVTLALGLARFALQQYEPWLKIARGLLTSLN
jgi:hypothetical protein